MTYYLTWLVQITVVLTFLFGIVFRSSWLLVIAVCLSVIHMFWPRCKRCGLPAFWQKQRGDPDFFLSYLGRPPFFPTKDCSRCGEDLTM